MGYKKTMTKKQLWEYFQKRQASQGYQLKPLRQADASLQLLLLQILLQQALKHKFQRYQELRVIVVLAYQILRLDTQAFQPYLVLAFVFALLHEYARAYQILLQAEHVLPKSELIQTGLAIVKQRLDMPQGQELEAPMAAVEVSFELSVSQGPPDILADKGLVDLSALPTLEESLALLENYQPEQLQRAHTYYGRVLAFMLQKVVALRPEGQAMQAYSEQAKNG